MQDIHGILIFMVRIWNLFNLFTISRCMLMMLLILIILLLRILLILLLILVLLVILLLLRILRMLNVGWLGIVKWILIVAIWLQIVKIVRFIGIRCNNDRLLHILIRIMLRYHLSLVRVILNRGLNLWLMNDWFRLLLLFVDILTLIMDAWLRLLRSSLGVEIFVPIKLPFQLLKNIHVFDLIFPFIMCTKRRDKSRLLYLVNDFRGWHDRWWRSWNDLDVAPVLISEFFANAMSEPVEGTVLIELLRRLEIQSYREIIARIHCNIPQVVLLIAKQFPINEGETTVLWPWMTTRVLEPPSLCKNFTSIHFMTIIDGFTNQLHLELLLQRCLLILSLLHFFYLLTWSRWLFLDLFAYYRRVLETNPQDWWVHHKLLRWLRVGLAQDRLERLDLQECMSQSVLVWINYFAILAKIEFVAYIALVEDILYGINSTDTTSMALKNDSYYHRFLLNYDVLGLIFDHRVDRFLFFLLFLFGDNDFLYRGLALYHNTDLLFFLFFITLDLPNLSRVLPLHSHDSVASRRNIFYQLYNLCGRSLSSGLLLKASEPVLPIIAIVVWEHKALAVIAFDIYDIVFVPFLLSSWLLHLFDRRNLLLFHSIFLGNFFFLFFLLILYNLGDWCWLWLRRQGDFLIVRELTQQFLIIIDLWHTKVNEPLSIRLESIYQY